MRRAPAGQSSRASTLGRLAPGGRHRSSSPPVLPSNSFQPRSQFRDHVAPTGISGGRGRFFAVPEKLFPALGRLRKDESYAKCVPRVGASKQYNVIVPRYVCLTISNSKCRAGRCSGSKIKPSGSANKERMSHQTMRFACRKWRSLRISIPADLLFIRPCRIAVLTSPSSDKVQVAETL